MNQETDPPRVTARGTGYRAEGIVNGATVFVDGKTPDEARAGYEDAARLVAALREGDIVLEALRAVTEERARRPLYR